MIETTRFHDLLRSLATLSHWQFGIWDGREALFCTGDGGCPGNGHAGLATKIVHSNRPALQKSGGGCIAGAPIAFGEAASGALLAWVNGNGATGDAGAEAIRPLLRQLGELIGESCAKSTELMEITDELSHSYEDVYLYGRLSGLIRSMHFSTRQVRALVDEIGEALHADLAFVAMADADDVILRIHEGAAPAAGEERFARRLVAAVPPGEPPPDAGYVIVNDSRLDPRFAALDERPFRALLVPIRGEGRHDGWIGIASFNMNQIFRRSELRLILSIAQQVHAVVTNTTLYNELRRFTVDMVKSLVKAIEAKDVYTHGHSERVCAYCLLIAERLGLGADETTNLQWAAMLHDVGKIGIDEAILNKDGPLTADEYEKVKHHPAQGLAILQPLAPLKNAMPGLLHHHERIDGHGYPEGLHGERIPLISRIIAVADTFDAIRSDRAYRKGRPAWETLQILRTLADSQLDRRIVELFVEIITQQPLAAEAAATGEGGR